MTERDREQYLLYLMQRLIDTSPLEISKKDRQDIKKIIFKMRAHFFHKPIDETEAQLELVDIVYSKLDDNIPKATREITLELIEDGVFSPSDTFSSLCNAVGAALKRLDTIYQVVTGIQVPRTYDTRHKERMFIKRPEPGTIMDLDFWNERLRLAGRRPVRYVLPAYPPLEESGKSVAKDAS